MTDSHPEASPHDSKVHTVPVLRCRSGRSHKDSDVVSVEEPLEIRIGDRPLAVTMRTPGEDGDLARGFLLSEGILLTPDEIAEIQRVDPSRISVQLQQGVDVDVARFQRSMFISSSCGVCGKASIEAVRILARPVRRYQIPTAIIGQLTETLRQNQPTFALTGGLHAAGVFDVQGTAISVREDVGRHNAVDKAIGAATDGGWPLPDSILVVSGRQSFEIVQKAAVVGIGAVVGISAPSSLAVELAASTGLLLVGFARDGTYNVYSGERRLTD